MKVSEINKLKGFARARGEIIEHPIKMYLGNKLVWEQLDESAIITPTGVLRARYDASEAQALTTTSYLGDTVVTNWDSTTAAIDGVNTTLTQLNNNLKPKLTTLNGLQAIKFDGHDAYSGTPEILANAPEYQAFKSDFEVTYTLENIEAGLFVRFFPWNERYIPVANLATSADVVYYQNSISNYWMVNSTATLGFNRVGSDPPPQNTNWRPVQLNGGTHETHYELPAEWSSQLIKAWTDQAPATETFYYENRGWYFGSGVRVPGAGDRLVTASGGSPLISVPGQQTKLNGLTIIILFQNNEDPDAHGDQP